MIPDAAFAKMERDYERRTFAEYSRRIEAQEYTDEVADDWLERQDAECERRGDEMREEVWMRK